jgi:hypothetical protein
MINIFVLSGISKPIFSTDNNIGTLAANITSTCTKVLTTNVHYR